MCHTDMHGKLLGFHALADAIQTCIKVAHTAWPEDFFVSSCEKFYSKDFYAVQMSAMPFSLLRNVSQTSFWHFHTVVSFAVYNKICENHLLWYLCQYMWDRGEWSRCWAAGWKLWWYWQVNGRKRKVQCIWFPLTLFSTQCTCVYFCWPNKQNKK